MSNETRLFSVDAEQTLVGALLIDGDAIDRIGDLPESAFYLDDCRRIFGAIRQVASSGSAVDVVTVGEALQARGDADSVGGFAALVELANACPSTAAVTHHAAIIRDRSLQRRIAAAAAEVHEVAQRPDRTTPEKLDFAQAAFAALSDVAPDKPEPASVEAVIARHLAMLERRSEGQDRGLSTGFPYLDKRLSGGLREGQLILIAARPAMGKTALALQIAAHAAAAGTTTLFCSQEMSESDLADRLLALQGRLPVERIISGSLHGDDWDRVGHAMREMQQMPLYLDEQPALTLLDVRNKARQVKRKAGGLGLVVVDYLQLMSGDGANRNAEIEEISRGLKRLAKEMRMPVIALSQLNRAVEQRPNKRPMLSDLRDSGAIEQDADVVMSVYRDEMYNPDSPHAGCAEIGMLKVRQGRAGGFVPLTYRGEQVRFEAFAGTWVEVEARSPRRRAFDD